VAALPPPQETVLRVQPAEPAAPAPAPPTQPSAEELRLAALQRVENALLQGEGARRGVQRDLTALGHLSGRADGRFGPGTRDAVRGFQAVAKLEPTGYVDRPTLDALRAQVARLRPAQEDEPRPARPPKQQPQQAKPAPTPEPEPAAAPTPPPAPAQRTYSAMTMGVCTTPGGSWASERHLTYAQCRKLGGGFEPF
jgi:peptidoglycan hydrolase-like protein with peptidoglycan-binding domain